MTSGKAKGGAADMAPSRVLRAGTALAQLSLFAFLWPSADVSRILFG